MTKDYNDSLPPINIYGHPSLISVNLSRHKNSGGMDRRRVNGISLQHDIHAILSSTGRLVIDPTLFVARHSYMSSSPWVLGRWTIFRILSAPLGKTDRRPSPISWPSLSHVMVGTGKPVDDTAEQFQTKDTPVITTTSSGSITNSRPVSIMPPPTDSKTTQHNQHTIKYWNSIY